MNERTVPVYLPEHVWGRLASLADDRGVTVADLIADGIKQNLEVPLTIDQRIIRWNRAGVPDPVIAHRMDRTVDWVRRCRRRLNLPHRRFRRDDWPELLTPAQSGVFSLKEAS